MKIKINSKKRLVVVMVMACSLFLCLIFRIGYLQLIKGEWLSTKASEQQTREIPIEAKRGTIYDTNMKEMAVSVTKYTVWCKPVEVKDAKETSQKLSQILEEEYDDVYKKVNKKNMALVKVKRWIDDETADKITKASLSGIWVAEDNQRYYPYGNFASYVLGHTSADSTGVTGIELQYDSVLKGTSGKLIVSTDAAGKEIPQGSEQYYEPTTGNGLVLTIDEVIQHYCEKAAQKAYEENNANKVTIIAMDPKTGDIKAMVKKPDYDPNTPTKAIYPTYEEMLENCKGNEKKTIEVYSNMWRNTIISDTYEPGSTFKIITASTALEENIVETDTNANFYCNGVQQVANLKIRCADSGGHGYQSLRQALENSCNPAFIQLGQKVGASTFYKYLRNYGFFDKTGIDLPSEGTSNFWSEDNVGPVELATMSFGQRFTITPMQLVKAASAIANDGVMVTPHVVEKIKNNYTGDTKSIETNVERQVISKDTADKMKDMMKDVVEKGGGSYAKVEGYTIGGKTGTSEPDPNHPENGYVASFLAIAPVENTKLVVLLTLYGLQSRNHYGGKIAAPVVSQILTEVLPYLNIPSNDSETAVSNNKVTIPNFTNKSVSEVKSILNNAGLNYSTKATADEIVTDQMPKAGSTVVKGGIVELYTKDNDTRVSQTVPDLKDQTYDSAKNMLSSKNLNISSSGTGIVVSQEPAAGTSVDEGTIISVTLKEKSTKSQN